MTSRRSFMKTTAALGAAGALGGRWGDAFAYYQTPSVIPLFVNPLRGVGPGGIPVAAPDSMTLNANGALHYTLDVNQYTDNIAAAGMTTHLWGYHPVNPLGGGSQAQKHLGGIIVGKKGQPIQLRFNNKLRLTAAALQGTATPQHILPNDKTIMGAADGDFRLATHFHGGLVPWISDGGPLTWFDDLRYGAGALLANGSNIFQAIDPTVPLGSAEYYYPLNQSARFGWYHDHAFGITRLNANAGIARA